MEIPFYDHIENDYNKRDFRSDELLDRINTYVENGGHVIFTFKSGFTNEHIQVRTTVQPGHIEKVCDVQYQMFVEPKNVKLTDHPYEVETEQNEVHTWMEFLVPTTAETLARYDHPAWGDYAAVTGNECGKGYATYIGCIVSSELMSGILKQSLKRAGIWESEQTYSFPLIIKSGTNQEGKQIKFLLNYSWEPQTMLSPYGEAIELLSGENIKAEQSMIVEPWGFLILEIQ